LGDEIILIANNPDPYAYLGLAAYGDIYPDSGPLGGIHTALVHAAYDHVLVVANDMPWLNEGLLAYLIELRQTADIVVPRWQKFPEPLHAVYSKQCLPPIEHNLASGDLKITRFFGRVRVRYVDPPEIERFDPGGRSFTNVNRPEDLPGPPS
ncbi:MAG: molybdenum cofactor guanylyltransferase, partial [Candidatus Promineifilaceae bacterium]